MQLKNLLFEESAVKEALEILKRKGYKWKALRYINKNRYCVVFGDPNIAILLKSEPFFNFGRMFSKFGESGLGDSINCQELKTFIKYKVRNIYVMFRNGKLYKIPLLEFLRKSHKWINKEGKQVRSISIHSYKPVTPPALISYAT